MLGRLVPDGPRDPPKGQLKAIVRAIGQGVPVDKKRVLLVQRHAQQAPVRVRVERGGRGRRLQRVLPGKVPAGPPHQSRVHARVAEVGQAQAHVTVDGDHLPGRAGGREAEAEVAAEVAEVAVAPAEEGLEEEVDLGPFLGDEALLADAAGHVAQESRVLDGRAGDVVRLAGVAEHEVLAGLFLVLGLGREMGE